MTRVWLFRGLCSRNFKYRKYSLPVHKSIVLSNLLNGCELKHLPIVFPCNRESSANAPLAVPRFSCGLPMAFGKNLASLLFAN